MASTYDVLILGGGIAGLSCAAALWEKGVRRIGVYADGLGGTPAIAAINFVLQDSPHGDSCARYAEDMLSAGYRVADPELIEKLCAHSPQGYALLCRWGVPFSAGADGKPLLRRTSGSSVPRSLCSTHRLIGLDILECLQKGLREKGVTLREGVRALRLLRNGDRVTGALVRTPTGDVEPVYGGAVVAAWGGVGHLLGASTYPEDVDGCMLAQAYQAGAMLTDLAFMEFEPLIVLKPDAAAGEPCPTAMLGEGAHLLNARGERFLLPLRPQGEAGAPKTLLNKAIWEELRQGRGTPAGGIYVDLRHIPVETLQAYPWFYRRLKNAGLDPAKELVEVAPLAHSFSGGIQVNEGCQATVPGLYAVGEAAGGHHGACRIGGNAAAQAVMSALCCAEAVAKENAPAPKALEAAPGYPWNEALRQQWQPKLQRLGSEALGAFRNEEGMARCCKELEALLAGGQLDGDQLCRDRALAIYLIARAALARRESRGVHLRTDYPEANPALARHLSLKMGPGSVTDVEWT